MIPFFFVQGFLVPRSDDGRGQGFNVLTLGMIAAVVVNVSGLMTGGLYLFLKSNTVSTIGPRDKAGEYENRRALYKDRHYDADDDEDDDGFNGRTTNSVAGPQSLRRVDSGATLLSIDKEEEALDGKSTRSSSPRNGRKSPESVRSNRIVSAVASTFMPKAPEPARVPPRPAANHLRKRSYSLFPRNTVASKASMLLLPATTYSPSDALKPPPSMANLANMRHRRDSSLVSTATVQIGIRLSSVDDIPPLARDNTATADSVDQVLGCPNIVKVAGTEGFKRVGAVEASATTAVLPLEELIESPRRDPVKDAKMKTLPPVPRINSQIAKVEPPQEEITLSPSVYSPNTPTKVKLPSPKGVGFSVPVPKSANGAPPRSPPRRRATGETTPPATDAKGAWI